MFAPEAYGVADLVGWVALGRAVTLRAGVLNLTDQKYFEWPNVRGPLGHRPCNRSLLEPGRERPGFACPTAGKGDV